MGAEFFLVIAIIGKGLAVHVIPQPYPDKPACEAAADAWRSPTTGYHASCIPAPGPETTTNDRR